MSNYLPHPPSTAHTSATVTLSRPGVGDDSPKATRGFFLCLNKLLLKRSHAHLFTVVYAFVRKQTETTWSMKTRICIIWLVAEKVCQPLLQTVGRFGSHLGQTHRIRSPHCMDSFSKIPLESLHFSISSASAPSKATIMKTIVS